MAGVKGLFLLALLILLATVALRAIVKWYEPRILFHPERGLEFNPAIAGLAYEDVYIRSGDVLIHGWLFPGKSDRWVVYYHGNAGTIADRIDFVRRIQPLGQNLLMIDYRGYGRSEGYPTVDGVLSDGRAAAAWLMGKKKIPKEKIVLWGHSLGAAVATATAVTHPGVGGIILESPFVSARRLAMELFPFVPVAFITPKFDNGKGVEALSLPKLIIHGTADSVVPYHHGEELWRRAREPKVFYPVHGASHSDISLRGGDQYLEKIGAWFGALAATGDKNR